jgi:hypothetical protein
MAISKQAVYFGMALIVFLLVIALFSAPDYQPYYKNIPYAKYEGFDIFGMSVGGNTMSTSVSVEPMAGNTTSVGGNVNATSMSAGAIFDSITTSSPTTVTQGFETLHPASTSGQGGVYSSGVNSIFTNQPVNRVVYGAKLGESEHLDYFLDVSKVGVDGQNGCQSSGLSNSLGELCLTPDLIQQLQTRGGNATGN